ncbi:MAG: SCO family protein [Xanthomonadaceae bacterium]|nr:SCO family protein [Xanthomonadaceae bacterium]
MMKRKTSIAAAITLAIVAVIAGMLLSRALLRPADDARAAALSTGTLLEPARPLPAFSLVDHEGKPYDRDRLANQWTFLFFGFTNCPDVCPMTLRMLSSVEQSLSDLPAEQRPHVILVSVDPKRDTPEQLASYVKYFSDSFAGITGEQAALDEFTRNLGVPVVITETGDGGYTVDHSATIFLINPQAELRALFSPPHAPSAIAADYRRIVGAPDTRNDG